MLAVHLDGTFFGTRAAARSMAQRRSGAIVNIASVCGIEGCTGYPHYSAAKAGILGFTRAVAKELIVQGIRVNAVAPGFIDTAASEALDDPLREAQRLRTPIGRFGRPRGDRRDRRVPRRRRRRLLRRRDAQSQRRHRHRLGKKESRWKAARS